MEKNEMNALLEQENAILSERLGALECAEEEVNEAIGQVILSKQLLAYYKHCTTGL